jgi:hypothetical protein
MAGKAIRRIGFWPVLKTGQTGRLPYNTRMESPIELLGTYLHLARAAELRRQPLVRDRVLVLAAVIAAQIDLEPIAEACRERILKHNPGHMLGRWPTVAEAMQEEDFQTLVSQLSTRYAPERVGQLVAQLAIERGEERAAYASDGEYAAGLLGVDWNELTRRFGDQDAD